MKKVVLIGLGVLLAIALALPVAADEDGGGLAGALEELYSALAGWFAEGLDSEPIENSEASASVPGQQTNSAVGTPSGPGVATEMTPMTLPGG